MVRPGAYRLYTNNQWPNPVVIKITHARCGVTPPKVTTVAAQWNAVGQTVVIQGRLEDLGKAATVEVGFQYRLKPEATEFTTRPWQATNLVKRAAAGEFTQEISGLEPGQRYECAKNLKSDPTPHRDAINQMCGTGLMARDGIKILMFGVYLVSISGGH